MKDELVSHFNDTLARFEETFVYHTGEICNWMVDFIGMDYLKSQKIEGNTLEAVLDSAIKAMVKAGVAEGITYSRDNYGLILKLKVKGCIHLSKEAKLEADGVRPYICPPGNMIADRIIEVLKWDHARVANTHHFIIDQANRTCEVKCSICQDTANLIANFSKIAQGK